MEVHNISLMDAYLIETLRSNGVSNEEILAGIEASNVEVWQELHKHFDFQELVKFANEDMERFQAILSQGYRVKFVTFNGLKNLLRLRFGKEQDKDYELKEKGISNLVLDQEQLMRVKQMLSENWVIEETTNANETMVDIEIV